MNISLMQGPGNSGFILKDELVYLVAHAAITAGTVYTADIATATVAASGVITDSGAAVDGAAEGTIWVLAIRDVASGDTDQFMLQGYADITNDGTNLAAEAVLSSTATGVVIAAPAGDVIIAISPEAETGTSGPCWFNGRGMGTRHA